MSFMFKFLLCSCFIAASYTKSVAEMKAWFMTLGIECTKDHPITADEMLMLHQHNIPDNPEVKCLLKCVYTKAGWVDSKGMFDQESANKLIEQDHVDDAEKIENSKKLFEICKKVNDVTDEKGCERSALLAKCMIDNAPKMGFELMR